MIRSVDWRSKAPSSRLREVSSYLTEREDPRTPYGAGVALAGAGDSFLGDFWSPFFQNKSPISKKLM
jgi:hypothetical protein